MVNTKANQLTQATSALGAGILGFGIGAKWGNLLTTYAVIIIIVGAILHVVGMYVMQMKDQTFKTVGIAKMLWISAWICLIALVAIIIYLLF